MTAKTGVEMEALTAVSVAALTIYDMCKAIDRGMSIEQVRLEEKAGGKSGHFVREDPPPTAGTCRGQVRNLPQRFLPAGCKPAPLYSSAPMPTTIPQPPPLLQLLYAPVAAELAEVERSLKAELRSDYPFVDELVRYGCLLGGKRLRPALLLLTAKAVSGRVTASIMTLAAVVEMIHTATLVHDDVLDEADVRRHLATVNARWDNEASVLLGDFLFTHAFYLASTLDNVLGCRLIGRATNIVCEGELRQKTSRGNFALSEAEYLEIIEAKTAELTAVSCRLGALFAGAGREVVERTGRLRPRPGHRLSDRRRPARPGGRGADDRQVARHRPGKAKAHAADHSGTGASQE